MALHMPALETDRLIVRPFTLRDLEPLYRVLDVELADAHTGAEHAESLGQRAEWLRWSVANYEQLARMYQPPFGDRAVALRESGELIGAAGFSPALFPFSLVPGLAPAPAGRASFELGLYWAISPRHQRRGYAAEAGRALIDYAFKQLGLWRIVATTEHDNIASQRVMEKLGMTLHRNPQPEPAYFQVVGVLEQ
jgi:RimJ/RimL family protein N-acetyltransferase